MSTGPSPHGETSSMLISAGETQQGTSNAGGSWRALIAQVIRETMKRGVLLDLTLTNNVLFGDVKTEGSLGNR